MSVLLGVPLDDGTLLLVETEHRELPGPVLASPDPGKPIAVMQHSLGDALDRLDPLVRAISERLRAMTPESVSVEFGIKLGGETGVILAKGTAEVNLKVTMTWQRPVSPVAT